MPLYRVTHKNNQWFVGGVPCTEDEAKEWISRGISKGNPSVIADRIMKKIKG